MKGFNIFLAIFGICLICDVIDANAVSRVKRQNEVEIIEKSGFFCDCTDCECVPYFQCADGNMITDGTGLIDIRIGKRNQSRSTRQASLQCPTYFHVCCKETAEYVEPAKIEYTSSCGMRNRDGVGIRITGNFPNTESQYGEFPWMAAVLREEERDSKTALIYVSGGALIRPDVVLTAAHHIARYITIGQTIKVRMGEWDSSIDTELFPHEDIIVDKVIIHEDFNPGNLHNDFALLFLNESFELSPNIETICLPTGSNDEIFTDDCVATGWGKDKFGHEGTFQNVLKNVELPIVDNDTCQKQLRTTRLGKNFVLDDSLMCAGGELGKDTCQGDGGSPLACRMRDDPSRYEVVGLVAYGIGCGEDGIPGVYANINREETIQWIEDSIQIADSS